MKWNKKFSTGTYFHREMCSLYCGADFSQDDVQGLNEEVSGHFVDVLNHFEGV